MKLHIGTRKRAEGWKTLDITPGPEVDFVGDCRDLSQFADGSIETIYASHVLEHVPYQKELLKTLREWFRVLKLGGTVMISVPDLDILCRIFLYPTLTPDLRFSVMRIMFGGQLDPHDFHYVGLTWDFLGSFLHQAGFVEIVRVPDLGLFDDSSRLKFGGTTLISLNVIAKKSGAESIRSAAT
jgi:predicted SAM-dependent methyltransferase